MWEMELVQEPRGKISATFDVFAKVKDDNSPGGFARVPIEGRCMGSLETRDGLIRRANDLNVSLVAEEYAPRRDSLSGETPSRTNSPSKRTPVSSPRASASGGEQELAGQGRPPQCSRCRVSIARVRAGECDRCQLIARILAKSAEMAKNNPRFEDHADVADMERLEKMKITTTVELGFSFEHADHAAVSAPFEWLHSPGTIGSAILKATLAETGTVHGGFDGEATMVFWLGDRPPRNYHVSATKVHELGQVAEEDGRGSGSPFRKTKPPPAPVAIADKPSVG